MILDEPTNHPDIIHQVMLMELAKKLDVTVNSAIHNLNIVVTRCDKIYVLKAGALEACGTPVEGLTPDTIFFRYFLKIHRIPEVFDGTPPAETRSARSKNGC